MLAIVGGLAAYLAFGLAPAFPWREAAGSAGPHLARLAQALDAAVRPAGRESVEIRSVLDTAGGVRADAAGPRRTAPKPLIIVVDR